jgi:hypothetical protein
MASKRDEKFPIIEILHGVPIRKSNTICLRFSEDAYRDLVIQSHNTSLSVSKIVILRNGPCQECGCDNVTVAVLKKRNGYRIQDNGNNLVKNGKGQHDTGESQDIKAQA